MTDQRASLAAETIAERIATWSSGLRFDALPRDVVHAAKRCIVDVVGVGLAAARHPLTRRVLDFVRREYARGAAGALASADRFSPVGAALVNGTASHALDFDDTSYTGIMHGSTVVLPAARAAVEQAGADGRRLLEAFVAGSEIAYTIAQMCGTRHYANGWWSTATFGVFGAAAAAARALALDASQTVSALALAGAQASGQKVVFGTDAKALVVGRTAAFGVEAALLARSGVTGPRAVFEGGCGFVQLMNNGHADPAEIDRLGAHWLLTKPGIFFKRYPVCSGAHAAVELTQRLLREHALDGRDVRKVLCEVTPVVAISLVYDRPETIQQAQFSLPFAVGTILAHSELGLDNLSDSGLRDAALRDAMNKVEMRRVDSLYADDSPEGARVTVTTTGGEVFQDYLGQPTGMPSKPLSDAQLRQKFIGCAAAGGIEEARAITLAAHLEALEEQPVAFAPFGNRCCP
jgi:2-methylcitrate dehydratase PrpD